METTNKDVKTLKREKIQLEHEHKKSIEDFNDKIQKLKELNAEKMSEEKQFKTREKKFNKKVRALEEERSKLKKDKEIFKQECNNNVPKVAKASQTEKYVDIPCEPACLNFTSVSETNLLSPIRLNNFSLNHTSLDPNSQTNTTMEPTSTNPTILDLTSSQNTGLDTNRLHISTSDNIQELYLNHTLRKTTNTLQPQEIKPLKDLLKELHSKTEKTILSCLDFKKTVDENPP